MKKLTITLLQLLIISITIHAQKSDGWTDLFNGKNLKGWKVINGAAEFNVEDGIIVGVSKMNTPNTFLATKKIYDDFILEYEAHIDPVLNAGVQIRSNSLPEYRDGIVHGYQIELDPSRRAWSGGLFDEKRRGWLYNLECNPKGKEAFKKNDWNQFRVEAIGNHIRVWVNGIQTVDLIDDMTASGFVALQVHSIGSENRAGKEIHYRNIRIKTKNLEAEKLPDNKDIPQVSYLNNLLTERELEEGWALLWDGQTTEGWRGAKINTFPDKGWHIENGELKVEAADGGESAHGGDIVTVQKYKNFVLEVDFKFSEGANSGIKYFVDTELNKGAGSSIGCEYQILDDKLHPDAKKGVAGNRTLGSLYDLIKAAPVYYSPNMPYKRVNHYGWNRAKIVVMDSMVEHYINGIKVVEYERGTQQWKALVAYSKYKNWPNFGKNEEGHILLQDHGDAVSFKNIKIKTL
jgi:hypothetical protein